MKKSWPPIILIFLLAASAFSQDRKPPPKSALPGDNEVVRISTNLIQLDVSVTDKKGNPITDLKPEEVEIYENGRLQNISNFSFVPGTSLPEKVTAAERKAATAEPGANLPAAPVRPEQVRRTIALVVDDLHLSYGSTFWVNGALKKFVNEQMQDGDLVAIIRTGAGVGALQQFTTDKRHLLAAIERVKFNSGGASGLSFFNPVETSLAEMVRGEPADSRFNINGTGAANDRELAQDVNVFRENIFASGTLGALNFIVRGMKDLPGRKSVVLLSDGLSLVTRDASGRPEFSPIYIAMQHLIDYANRSSVVFYTIHAPGLIVPMLEAADNVQGISGLGGELTTNRIMAGRINSIDDSQQGLRYLSEGTGGLAYFNQNDISRGIRRVLDDQSYYLVGYVPDDDTFNSKQSRFNKFEIKVKRDGAQVRYRSGFFGISEEQIVKPNLSVTDTLIGALTSPFAVNEVTVRMNAIFAGDEKQTGYVRTVINVDASDLTFKKEADGRIKTAFDIVAITLGDTGKVLDERSQNIVLRFDEPEHKKFVERGLVTTFILPIKNPGGYQVRLAVRDVETGRVGSANQFIEVPNLKKNNLTLSGMALENVPFDTWQQISSLPDAEKAGAGDSFWDTSVRQFKAGSVLRFAYQVHNAKVDRSNKANLIYHLRLFNGRELVFESDHKPVVKMIYDSPKMISATGGIRLGEALVPGDYILQVDITDNISREKGKTATQFVQFEVVQ